MDRRRWIPVAGRGGERDNGGDRSCWPCDVGLVLAIDAACGLSAVTVTNVADGTRLVRFEASYRAAIEAAAAMGRDLTTCTIYNANLEPELAPAFRVALMMFNDVILRVAFERRLSVIDLRLVCTTAADYANRIEPSGSGGLKIARAIVRRLGIGGADAAHARVFA